MRFTALFGNLFASNLEVELMKPKFFIWLLSTLLVMSFFALALAGTKGKITGKVIEKDRGNYEDICF